MHQQVTACNLLPNWTNCFAMFVGGLCRLIAPMTHGQAVNDGVEGEGVAFALESVLLHEDQFGLTTAPVVVWATAEGRPTSKKTLRPLKRGVGCMGGTKAAGGSGKISR